MSELREQPWLWALGSQAPSGGAFGCAASAGGSGQPPAENGLLQEQLQALLAFQDRWTQGMLDALASAFASTAAPYLRASVVAYSATGPLAADAHGSEALPALRPALRLLHDVMAALAQGLDAKLFARCWRAPCLLLLFCTGFSGWAHFARSGLFLLPTWMSERARCRAGVWRCWAARRFCWRRCCLWLLSLAAALRSSAATAMRSCPCSAPSRRDATATSRHAPSASASPGRSRQLNALSGGRLLHSIRPSHPWEQAAFAGCH